ncbi:hypothetical protein [Xanthomonas sacchari]|uniref:hypothetical protein n=1 Tax=Xanthomonas sacchari TaxID=56458 RepID=UPI00224F9891|nr:hypothetical protein [Xanthomonas sacchari]
MAAYVDENMEVIVAALAAFIAFLAWHAQRTHNRLSVCPFPAVGMLSYHDRLKIYVRNHGSGPMRIKTLRFVDLSGVSHGNVLKLVSSKAVYGVTTMDEAALGPNKSRTLLKMKGNPAEGGKDLEITASELASYKIVIEYADVYGAKFPPYIRDLSWFAEDS